MICRPIVPDDQIFGVPLDSDLQIDELRATWQTGLGTPHLQLMVLRYETLHVLHDHLALDIRQAVDALQVVAHAVDCLPTCHWIRSDARMRCTEGGSNVFGR